MILASILISTDDAARRPLPMVLAKNVASLRDHHPGITHTLFDGPMLREELRAASPDILAAYDALAPFAYKADLARYVLLHRHGGIYADLAIRFLRPWPVEPGRIGVFRDFPTVAPWSVLNGVIASPPGHPALQRVIEMVVETVRRRDRTGSALSVTGPELFGRALAATAEPHALRTGESVWRRAAGLRKRHCLVHGGRVIAVKLKNPGLPFGALGIPAGNDYLAMWRGGEVYAAGAPPD